METKFTRYHVLWFIEHDAVMSRNCSENAMYRKWRFEVEWAKNLFLATKSRPKLNTKQFKPRRAKAAKHSNQMEFHVFLLFNKMIWIFWIVNWLFFNQYYLCFNVWMISQKNSIQIKSNKLDCSPDRQILQSNKKLIKIILKRALKLFSIFTLQGDLLEKGLWGRTLLQGARDKVPPYPMLNHGCNLAFLKRLARYTMIWWLFGQFLAFFNVE